MSNERAADGCFQILENVVFFSSSCLMVLSCLQNL
jgi:hypothetical protein